MVENGRCRIASAVRHVLSSRMLAMHRRWNDAAFGILPAAFEVCGTAWGPLGMNQRVAKMFDERLPTRVLYSGRTSRGGLTPILELSRVLGIRPSQTMTMNSSPGTLSHIAQHTREEE